MAVAHSQNGDPKQAIVILKDLIKAQPNVALAHFNLATIYAHQKQFREAADEYQEALRLDPADDTSRLSLVKALTTIGLYSDALVSAQEYAKRHPEDYEGCYLAHFSFGLSHARSGKQRCFGVWVAITYCRARCLNTRTH